MAINNVLVLKQQFKNGHENITSSIVNKSIKSDLVSIEGLVTGDRSAIVVVAIVVVAVVVVVVVVVVLVCVCIVR